jgi:nicotinamide riboside kinase
MAKAVRLALLGAECTAKSELTLALRETIEARTGARVAAVGEWLREWCVLNNRTPQPSEQTGIAQEQQDRIEAACVDHDVVVCDTTPLMTAVYSQWYFGDASLLPQALIFHRSIDRILLTDLDIPWQADGVLRDGQIVRQAIDERLRATLRQHGLPFTVVQGLGAARVDCAWEAVRDLVSPKGAQQNARTGRYTRR